MEKYQQVTFVIAAGPFFQVYVWTNNLMSVCVCMWFSKPLRLPVGVCVYIQLCASLYSLYMYITACCSS